MRTDTATPLTRRFNAAGLAVFVCCGLLLASAASTQAYARALPGPQEDAPLIERSALGAAAPLRPSPEVAVLDKTLQALRATALQEPAAPSDGSAPPHARQRTTAPRTTQGNSAPADAAWLLGLLALHGLAMPADLPLAQHWFERAHLLGHPLAAAGAAWCQVSGCVSPPSPSGALRFIAPLRRTDPALARYLEWHVARAMAPLPPPTAALSPAKGPVAQLLADAARAGNVQAQNELGLEYLAAGHLEQALAQFQAAAPRSYAAAANADLLAGRMGVAGEGGPAHRAGTARTEPTRPEDVRRGAADRYQQARRYHQGDGVPANYTEAVRLYQLAAAGGDLRASQILQQIFSRPGPGGSIDIAWMQQLAPPGRLDHNTGMRQGTTAPAGPTGWQRDPSPLYDRVPAEWRAQSTGAVR